MASLCAFESRGSPFKLSLLHQAQATFPFETGNVKVRIALSWWTGGWQAKWSERREKKEKELNVEEKKEKELNVEEKKEMDLNVEEKKEKYKGLERRRTS